MDNTSIISDVSKREILEKCHDVKIDGISIYYFVRRPLFERYIRQYGSQARYRSPNTPKYRRIISAIYSLFQIIVLILKRKKIK